MPTGLRVNKGLASVGNINIQAVKPQSSDSFSGMLNTDSAFVVGANKIVSTTGDITQNPTKGVGMISNPFQRLEVALPHLASKRIAGFTLAGFNNLLISPIIARFILPGKLRGISEQRPEIISLSDFGSIYRSRFGSELSDTGEFINTSIAARKLRYEHMEALIEGIQEVEDANAILEDIADNYADEVLGARETINLMSKISLTIKNIKKSLDIRKSEDLKNERFAKNIVSSRTYKDFLVEEYGFSDSGFANFSNTKIFGQFLFDVRNTLKQYSPSLFGTNSPPPPNNLNSGVGGFQTNQPDVGENFFDSNFSLGEAEEQTIERNADREFGTYNVSQTDITDGQFNFQVRLFKNISFSILGTPFNQFLDILPRNSLDRTALLLMTLSKELRISSGMGDENVKNILFETFGGSDVGDPFEFVIGSPGDSITDVPNGPNSLCSLLRYTNEENDVILPFESVYVRGEGGRLFTPGSKEIADSIIQSEEPYDISRLVSFQERFSQTSSDAISVIAKLLDVGKKRPRLKPVDLFNEISNDFIEGIDNLISNLPSGEAVALPGSWAPETTPSP